MRRKQTWVIFASVMLMVAVSIVGVATIQASPTLCNTAKNETSVSTNADANKNCTESVGVYGVEMRALMAEMVAHPYPELEQIPVDERMLYQRAYRKVLKETDIYNAPGGGQVVGHIDAGFNFVNAGETQNGWVVIRPNQWVPAEVLGPVNKSVSKFAGVLLPDGFPERSFGWVLDDNTKPSKIPGAKPDATVKPIKRYTLVNFFATQVVDGWEWYLIGPQQWIIQKHVAFPKPVKRPDGVTGKWFAVDLFEQTMVAYDNDKPVFATMISSGLPKFRTSEGLFKIWDRYALVKMSGASGQPDFYYLPQVPFVMYFNQEEQALHGAYWHDYFGWPRSHGCVNMSMTDAQWAFNWTQDSPEAYVYVYYSQEPKAGVGTLR
jgi:hypothetical protein